jgi:hypothetical protein
MPNTIPLKHLLFIAGVLMVAGLGYAAMTFTKQGGLSKSERSPTVDDAISFQQNDISPTSTVVAPDWKTYINSQWGYSIRIPNDWMVRENDMRSKVYFISSESYRIEEHNTQLCTNGLPGCGPDLPPMGVYVEAERASNDNLNERLNESINRIMDYTTRDTLTLGVGQGVTATKVTVPGMADHAIIFFTNNESILYRITTDSSHSPIFDIIIHNFQLQK